MEVSGSQHASQRIDVRDESVCKVVGKGDDGVVVRPTADNSTAIKIFISKTFLKKQKEGGGVADTSFYMEISKDQALREVKSMKLLESYPNFLKLSKERVESIDLTTGDGIHVPRVPGVFMQFQENLLRLDEVMRYWGFKGHSGNKTPQTMNQMNFQQRNILYKYVLHQLYDALLTMQSIGIQHRDLDECNVLVVYPATVIKIMDFARADVPDVSGYLETENPLNITTTAMRHEEVEKTQEKKELWSYCISQYSNPLNIKTVNHTVSNTARVPKYVELSDENQISLLIDRVTGKHLYDDFEWGKGVDNKEGIIQENILLLKFIGKEKVSWW